MKERIVGAAVLVLVVVLVVPVFLDGPPGDDEIVSTTVPLPGQAEQKTQTVVLERDREDPVPAATSSTPDAQQPQPVVRQQPPAPAAEQTAPDPVVTEEPAAEPASSSTTGMWAVQLGSFGNQENANRLAAELRSKNFMASVSKMTTNSGERHRVRVGPQKDRASADAMAARLKEAGYDGKVMPHP